MEALEQLSGRAAAAEGLIKIIMFIVETRPLRFLQILWKKDYNVSLNWENSVVERRPVPLPRSRIQDFDRLPIADK